jgi:peptidoglycan/LPS O-acetylase OafA/YrhL
VKVAPTQTRSFGEFQNSHYFTALDGLRAISILLVMLHHVTRLTFGSFDTLQENGRYGVSFFFVISGFLICTLFLREKRKTGGIALGKFYGRRTLRLLPLYYSTLALTAVLVFGLHQYSPENQGLFREKLPSYFFYYSNWLATSTQGPFFCSWSLAVEEQFYLVFGLMLFFLPRRFLIGTLLACLLTKFAVCQILGNVDVHSTTLRVVFSYQEAIIWGVLLAFALDQRKIYELLENFFRSIWAIVIPFIAVGWWLGTHRMQSQCTWDAEILYILMTLIVAGVAIRHKTPILGTGMMAHVGKTSYGIYLLHTFVIYAVKKMPGGSSTLVCLIISIAVVIPLAALVYHYFEEPIIRFYKSKLSPGSASPPAAQPMRSIGGTGPCRIVLSGRHN